MTPHFTIMAKIRVYEKFMKFDDCKFFLQFFFFLQFRCTNIHMNTGYRVFFFFYENKFVYKNNFYQLSLFVLQVNK
jgi:hypothetical protein